MGNFLNNGPKILKLIVRVRIYHILINIQKKNRFEIWIFKNFFLKIYRNQTDYKWYKRYVINFFVVVIVWQLDIQLPVQSVHITTKVVSLNLGHGEVYSIQHYVIKFVSDLRHVGGFLRILLFAPPIKLTATIQLKNCSTWR